MQRLFVVLFKGENQSKTKVLGKVLSIVGFLGMLCLNFSSLIQRKLLMSDSWSVNDKQND